MDRRMTPSNGRVAHVSLRGQVEAERFVKGEAFRIASVVADLLSRDGGARERQLLRGGEVFTVLETADGKAFGFAQKDGYCGWLDATAFVSALKELPTHRISAARSYAKSTPGLKAMGAVTPLPFGGVQLTVLEQHDGWAKVAWGGRGTIPNDLYVPLGHLAPIQALEDDPATVAELFLGGTPYLWGGKHQLWH